MKHVLLVLCLVTAGLSLTSCGEDNPGAVCGPANCMGCCTVEGRCIPSPDATSCGANGAICMACPLGSQCLGGVCKQPSSQCSPANCSGCCSATEGCVQPINNQACSSPGGPCVDCTQQQMVCDPVNRRCITGSGCTPSCTKKCAGASDGCGGSCQVNDCTVGCCLNGQCVAGKSDYACGRRGANCANCFDQGSTCSEAGSCANCTPNCSGKCAGASDGCGDNCLQNGCSGCCSAESDPKCLLGSANDACGAGGGQCTDCSATGSTCSGGSCAGCTPNCSGKCAGASDECGGTCTTNQCADCCTTESSPRCLSGMANTACGSSGATCSVCPSDYQGYSWLCDSNTKTCVKDAPTSIDCSSQPNGTTGCTDNGLTGTCWNGQCCTGCYNGEGGYCVSFTWDYYCGTGGQVCTNCALSNQTCENGACVVPSGPCGGLPDNAPCTDGGREGRCMWGHCCTGCFDNSYGYTTCYEHNEVNADHCGAQGSGCISCDDYEYCTSYGSCLIDFNAQVVMTIASAKILENKTWDSYPGSWAYPDPGVCLWWNNASCGSATTPLISGDVCTAEMEDTYYPLWLHDLPAKTIADLLFDDICIQLMDWDVAGIFELIGSCLLDIRYSDIKNGYLTLWECPHPTQGNYVDFIHFTFRPAP